MNYVAANIKWDTDGNETVAKSLPKNVLILDGPNDLDDEMQYRIESILSDEVGFCHFGFEYLDAALVDFDIIHVGKIIHFEG